MGRMTDANDHLKFLKNENESLRIRTIEMLKRPNKQPLSQQKA